MLPFLYDSPYFSLQTVWIFAVIALLTGAYLAIERLKRSRVNFTFFIEHSVFFFLTALLFSRAVYFFTHLDAYFPGLDLRTVFNFFSIWDQGFSFWGGLVGFTLALLYRLRKSEEKSWKWLDTLIVPLIVGMGIGSVGNFLGGVSYGRPTELPWGIRYEIYNVKYTVPVHPVQIYTLLFLILVLVSKKFLDKKTDFFQIEGTSTLYYTSILGLGFFVLEFFRGDDTLLLGGLRFPQLLFLLLFLLSAFYLNKRYYHFKHPSHEPESP